MILLTIDKWLSLITAFLIIWIKITRINALYFRYSGRIAQVNTSGAYAWSIICSLSLCLTCFWTL